MKKFGQLLGMAASIATVLGLIITIAAPITKARAVAPYLKGAC